MDAERASLSNINALLEYDYFKLFGLLPTPVIDTITVKKIYHQLQLRFHPDNFLNTSHQTQNLINQLSAKINQAYNVLTSEFELLKLFVNISGICVYTEPEKVVLPVNILSKYMIIYEQLEDAIHHNDMHTVNNIKTNVNENYSKQIHMLQSYLQTPNIDPTHIVNSLNEISFFKKILSRILKTLIA